MKFLASQILVSAALVNLVNAVVDCGIGNDGPASVLACLEQIPICPTSLTRTEDSYPCACSYAKAAVACETSICGDTLPSSYSFSSVTGYDTSRWCGGGGAAPTATAAATASNSGSVASATGTGVASATGTGAASATGTGASTANIAGSMITPFPEQAILLAAGGLVGAFL